VEFDLLDVATHVRRSGQEPLEAAIAVLHNPVEPLTSDELAVLKEVSAILYPVDEVTTEISAEQAVTVSKVILLFRGLMLACHDMKKTLANNLNKDLMARPLDGLKNKFGTTESVPLFSSAIFLDPRFKKDGFFTDSCCSQTLPDMTALVQRRIATTEHTAATASDHSAETQLIQGKTNLIIYACVHHFLKM
jgi:hypothetical protein